MHIPPMVFPLVISIGVYVDAKVIGIKKGQLTGFFNMGAGMWAFACFLFLIIALPAYLFKRGEYKQINAQLKAQDLLQQGQDQSPPGQVWPPPPTPPGAP